MDLNFVDDYGLLFGSLVIYCSVVLLYLVFYVNDKSQKINLQNIKELKSKKETEEQIINTYYDKRRKELINKSKKNIARFLLVNIVANITIILIKNYITLIGLIGGLLFPIIAYFILVFVLLVAIGLKGQRVLIVRGLIHGRE